MQVPTLQIHGRRPAVDDGYELRPRVALKDKAEAGAGPGFVRAIARDRRGLRYGQGGVVAGRQNVGQHPFFRLVHGQIPASFGADPVHGVATTAMALRRQPRGGVRGAAGLLHALADYGQLGRIAATVPKPRALVLVPQPPFGIMHFKERHQRLRPHFGPIAGHPVLVPQKPCAVRPLRGLDRCAGGIARVRRGGRHVGCPVVPPAAAARGKFFQRLQGLRVALDEDPGPQHQTVVGRPLQQRVRRGRQAVCRYPGSRRVRMRRLNPGPSFALAVFPDRGRHHPAAGVHRVRDVRRGIGLGEGLRRLQGIGDAGKDLAARPELRHGAPRRDLVGAGQTGQANQGTEDPGDPGIAGAQNANPLAVLRLLQRGIRLVSGYRAQDAGLGTGRGPHAQPIGLDHRGLLAGRAFLCRRRDGRGRRQSGRRRGGRTVRRCCGIKRLTGGELDQRTENPRFGVTVRQLDSHPIDRGFRVQNGKFVRAHHDAQDARLETGRGTHAQPVGMDDGDVPVRAAPRRVDGHRQRGLPPRRHRRGRIRFRDGQGGTAGGA